MRPDRAWVRLDSGRRLDLLDPQPDAWDDRDLAVALSRTHRWGGHSEFDAPLSVAQHSLTVLALRQRMQAYPILTPGKALRELLSDADTGFLCFDPISPVKRHLGAEFHALTSRLRSAIATRYALPDWTRLDYIMHKQADNLSAASEAVHVAGWHYGDLRETLNIQLMPLQHDPLPLLDGLQPWEPWPARIAAALFLHKLRELDGAFYVEAPADLTAAIERQATLARLGVAFSRLPPRMRARCARPLTGNSLTDTFVHVEAGDHSASIEGVIVDGERDGEGGWDFDAPFTVLTTDGELIVCRGDCHVDVQ